MGRDLPPIDTGENEAGQNNAPSAVGSQGTSPADEETLVLPVHAPGCESVQGRGVGDAAMKSWLTESQSIAHIRHPPEQYHVQ